MTPFQLIAGVIGVWLLMGKIKKQAEIYPGIDKPPGSDEYPGAEKAPDAFLASPHFRWDELIVSRSKRAMAAEYRKLYPSGRWPFFLDETLWQNNPRYKYSDALNMAKKVYPHLMEQPISANMVDHLNNIVEPLRAHLGVPLVVSSGWRPPVMNTSTRQAFSSGHMMGVATDIRAGAALRAKATAWAREHKDIVGYYHNYSSFFHIGSPRGDWDHTFK